MAYKAIIFDFFDVIHADPLNRWLERIGLQKEGASAIEAASADLDVGRISVPQFFERLSETTGQPAAEIQAEHEQYAAVNYPLLELLGRLKERYKVGLLSNASSDFLRGLLRTHDMERLFHHIVISSDVGMRKPSREIFQHMLEKLAVAPADAVFIDDNIKNVQAAEDLGITGVQYTEMSSLRRELRTLGIET